MPIARIYVAVCTDFGTHCPDAADTAAEARIVAQTLHRWETLTRDKRLVDLCAHCAGKDEELCAGCGA